MGYSSLTYYHAREALNKITKESYLKDISENARDDLIKSQADKKLNNISAIQRMEQLYPIFYQESIDSRKELVENMDEEDILSYIALNDENELLREAAVKNKNLNDNKILSEIIVMDESAKVRRAVITDSSLSNEGQYNYLDDAYNFVALKDNDRNNRRYALEKVYNENILRGIVENETDSELLEMAQNKLDSITLNRKTNEKLDNYPELLDSDINVRLNAVEKVTDQSILMDVARNDSVFDVRLAAISKISDQSLLREIAETAEKINDGNTRRKILDEIKDNSILLDLAENTSKDEVVNDVFYCMDNSSLIDFIENTDDKILRYMAIKNVNSTKCLKRLLNSSDKDIISDVIHSVNDYDVYTELITDSDEEFRKYVISNIYDENILERFAISTNKDVNYLALNRLLSPFNNSRIKSIVHKAEDNHIKEKGIEYIYSIDGISLLDMTGPRYYCSNCNKMVYKNASSCPYCKVQLEGVKIIRK